MPCPHGVEGCVGEAVEGILSWHDEPTMRREAGRRLVRGQLCAQCSKKLGAIAAVRVKPKR